MELLKADNILTNDLSLRFTDLNILNFYDRNMTTEEK